MPRFSLCIINQRIVFLKYIKANQITLLLAVLSSKHKFVKIDKSNKNLLPGSIKFYNNTKSGVDIADQMTRKYTVKASSRGWPLQIFFNVLDLADINTWILYKETTWIQIQRKEFLFQLAEPNIEMQDRKFHQNLRTHKGQMHHHQMQPILTNAEFVKYDFFLFSKWSKFSLLFNIY